MNNLAPKQTLYDDILDRQTTEIPDYYLPSATVVLIAGASILRGIGYVPGSNPPPGWKRGAEGLCRCSRAGDRMLWVQRCGDFWIVERSARTPVEQDEALVCAFSGSPIWTKTMVSAMLLAEHCDPLPTAVAARWAIVTS